MLSGQNHSHDQACPARVGNCRCLTGHIASPLTPNQGFLDKEAVEDEYCLPHWIQGGQYLPASFPAFGWEEEDRVERKLGTWGVGRILSPKAEGSSKSWW